MPLTGLCGAEVIEEWLQSLAQPLCAGLTLPLLASGRCLHCLRPSPQPPLHLGPGGDNLWPSPFWVSEECSLVPYIRNTGYLPYISPGSPKYFEDGFCFPLSLPTGGEPCFTATKMDSDCHLLAMFLKQYLAKMLSQKMTVWAHA